MLRRLRSPALALFATGFLLPRVAAATDLSYAVNAEGAASHLVGENKAGQFGWGGTGLVAPELKFGRRVGLELPLGVVGLTQAGYQDPAYAPSGSGSAFLALPGLRVRPLPGWADTIWFAAGGGVADTAGTAHPSVDVRAGVDVKVSSLGIGPFAGLVQIVDTTSGVRSEDARLVLLGFHASISPTPKVKDGDRDGDGIPDSIDKCPDEPEDFDGFEDADGCPDPDNDHDGIPDALDKCPNEGGEFVIRDPNSPYFGCPDRDGDGIPDAIDKCPNEPEDFDGFQDADGCPDPDNDHDGIPDALDKCPNDPETFNGFEDEDGCPDEEMVRVAGDNIVLDDRVLFPIDQSKLLLASHPMLHNLAKLLQAHLEYEQILISGHADDTGESSYNLHLSEARANSVRTFLIQAGVAPERLVVQFYGMTKPRVVGTSLEARKQNRRVEFEIVQRRIAKKLPPPLVPRVEHAALAPTMHGGAR